MKLIPVFIFALALITSCNNSNKVIKERLVTADSAAINYFAGDGNMDSVVLVKMIRDKKQLQQLATFISSSSTEDFKCGFDGSIHFFARDMVMQDIDFRMNDVNCMYFRLLSGGKLYTAKLSPEAKQFLESMRSNP